MSLSSALNAGVAGLSVNATRLAAISDNIANSSTNGYRRVDVDFASLVLPGGSNSFSAGGVTSTTIRDVTTAGALIGTGNSTDISVSGRGMLPVTTTESVELGAGERPFQMVATGSFTRDANGNVVTQSGLALLGWPTDADGALLGAVTRESPASLVPVQISPFLTAADPTTNISLGINLPANETTAGALGNSFESTLEYFDSIGRANQLRAVFTPTVPASGSSNQWQVSFFDSATDPAVPIAELDLAFDDSRTGRGALLSVTPVGGVPYDPVTGVTLHPLRQTTSRKTAPRRATCRHCRSMTRACSRQSTIPARFVPYSRSRWSTCPTRTGLRRWIARLSPRRPIPEASSCGTPIAARWAASPVSRYSRAPSMSRAN
jgi:flagellar hook protein FlgE